MESYTSSAAPHPDGTVWVKHGILGPIEVLNGYSAPHFPEPGGSGKLETASDGAVWIWSSPQIKRCLDGHWTAWPVPEITALGTLRGNSTETTDIIYRGSLPGLRGTIQVAAVDHGRALILLPDRVLEFSADRGNARVVLVPAAAGLHRFVGMAGPHQGAVVITGDGGIGKLVSPGSSGTWRWEKMGPPAGEFSEFASPSWGAHDILCVSGSSGNNTSVVTCLRGSAWKTAWRSSSHSLRAWAGEGESVWVRDGNHIVQVANGEATPAPRDQALSGILLSVTAEPDGRFWVSSSQGLAHYTPLLWRSPTGAPALDDVVNAIMEDPLRRVWFLSARHLLCVDGDKWSVTPLPPGETPWAVFTEGLGVVETGEIVIRTTSAHLLLFNPATRSFRQVQHPGSRPIRLMVRDPSGRLLVEVNPAESEGSSIEVFDGQRFIPWLSGNETGAQSDLRTLSAGENGEVWVGSTTDFGVWRGGKFEKIDSTSGYDDKGAYYVYRDPAGTLFAGARDGLYRQEGQRWRKLQSGLDRVRNVITARDGTLWVASGTGVHRYREGNWILNGVEEGLPSSVVYRVFEDSRGRIWAGTTRGLSLFHPDADREPPLATISGDQNPVETPPGGNVHLVFSGIDKWKFTPPERLLFSWRMDNERWGPFLPVSSASFAQLPAGRHSFEVRAMDRNGNVSARAAVHRFAVMVPWFSTREFRSLSAVVAILIGALMALVASNYRRRGELIVQLNRKNRLESDRQRILEMIAEREPLQDILHQIAGAAGTHVPGCACAVLLGEGPDVEIHSDSALAPPELTGKLHAIADWRSDPTEVWRAAVQKATGSAFPGGCRAEAFRSKDPLRSIDSGGRGILAVFLRSQPDKGSEIDAVLRTFAALATGACENAHLYSQLGFQARHDALTGLPNRLQFEEQLDAAVAARDRFGLLYIDLDRFKQINDTLGHRAGDLFLQRVASRLSGALSPCCGLFRIGGDEFIVIAPHPKEGALGHNGIEKVTSEIFAALRTPIRIDGQDLFASASIGASTFPADGDDPATLQKHADIAMYRAKSRGPNRLEFYTAGMATNAETTLCIERTVRRALDENLFELYYQPQYTLAGEVAGFEALLRFAREEDRGVGPASFIPVAESAGLIGAIGSWVIREACRQIRMWLDEGWDVPRIAVNVSASEITQAAFPDQIRAALACARLEPERLELELTESAIIESLTDSARQMKRLKAMGVRLTIDDFGTGYSSLSYLHALPVDALKIDRSFVNTIESADDKAPLIQAIVALGRNLGLEVVAEGVETSAQMAVLSSTASDVCDYIQGYFLGKPMPAGEARRLLKPGGAIVDLARLGGALRPEPTPLVAAAPMRATGGTRAPDPSPCNAPEHPVACSADRA